MEATEESPYNRDYYATHRLSISELRKIKYHTDAAYRENLKAKARRYYRDHVKSKDPDNKIGYTVKVVDGVTCFTLSHLLNLINKSRDFLLTWESTGHIPQSTYTDRRGWRLYTEYQISLLDMAISKYDEKKWNKEQVRVFLDDNWNG